VALWIFSVAAARRIARAMARGTARVPAERLVWAVQAASRRVPRATCLVQAVAADALLTRAGYESVVEIGVAKDNLSRFEAHAWVRCGGRIVIGGPDVARYACLTTFQR
jgi:hypothetical protein